MCHVPTSEWASTVDIDLEKPPTERTLRVEWNLEEGGRGGGMWISWWHGQSGHQEGDLVTCCFCLWPFRVLTSVRLHRCYKPAEFKDIKKIKLHHFVDASVSRYGTASYLRFRDVDNRIHWSLIMGKSRVAPLKTVTVPRLEPTAATLAVKVNKQLWHVHIITYKMCLPAWPFCLSHDKQVIFPSSLGNNIVTFFAFVVEDRKYWFDWIKISLAYKYAAEPGAYPGGCPKVHWTPPCAQGGNWKYAARYSRI